MSSSISLVAFKPLIEEFSCLQSHRMDHYFHRHHPQSATILQTKKRSRAECYEVFEALNMAENLGGKIEEILRKLGKLNIIESQLNEMHAKITNIEETVSRLDREVKSSKNTTKKAEKMCRTRGRHSIQWR